MKMCRIVLVFCFLFFYSQIAECGVYGRSGSGGGSSSSSSNSGRSSYGGRRNSQLMGSSYDEQLPQPAQQKGAPTRSARSSGGGLSAWGLIMIITTVIIFGFGAYYGIICYPFLCKNERTYQFMDGSSTITGATSRSIQSIENFQHDQKAAI